VFARPLRSHVMAIEQFICRNCQKRFDVMHPALAPVTNPTCPHCGSTNVERTESPQTVTPEKS